MGSDGPMAELIVLTAHALSSGSDQASSFCLQAFNLIIVCAKSGKLGEAPQNIRLPAARANRIGSTFLNNASMTKEVKAKLAFAKGLSVFIAIICS
jgi:hypothetical protein